jgi:hypothetical protein
MGGIFLVLQTCSSVGVKCSDADRMAVCLTNDSEEFHDHVLKVCFIHDDSCMGGRLAADGSLCGHHLPSLPASVKLLLPGNNRLLDKHSLHHSSSPPS